MNGFEECINICETERTYIAVVLTAWETVVLTFWLTCRHVVSVKGSANVCVCVSCSAVSSTIFSYLRDRRPAEPSSPSQCPLALLEFWGQQWGINTWTRSGGTCCCVSPVCHNQRHIEPKRHTQKLTLLNESWTPSHFVQNMRCIHRTSSGSPGKAVDMFQLFAHWSGWKPNLYQWENRNKSRSMHADF